MMYPGGDMKFPVSVCSQREKHCGVFVFGWLAGWLGMDDIWLQPGGTIYILHKRFKGMTIYRKSDLNWLTRSCDSTLLRLRFP